RKPMGQFKAGDRLGVLPIAGRAPVSSLRRRVEIGCKVSRLNQLLSRPSRDWEEIPRLAIAGGNRSGLVENQGLDVACGFDRLPGRGQDVEAHRTGNSSNSDTGQKRA